MSGSVLEQRPNLSRLRLWCRWSGEIEQHAQHPLHPIGLVDRGLNSGEEGRALDLLAHELTRPLDGGEGSAELVGETGAGASESLETPLLGLAQSFPPLAHE
jgi:hypothetical protein